MNVALHGIEQAAGVRYYRDGSAAPGCPILVRYADDLIEGIYRLLLSSESDPVNIGNPGEMSVLEFARLIKKLTGAKSEIVFKPLPVDDPKQRQPDITLAGEKLGWKPNVSVDEGLKRTIEFFRKELS